MELALTMPQIQTMPRVRDVLQKFKEKAEKLLSNVLKREMDEANAKELAKTVCQVLDNVMGRDRRKKEVEICIAKSHEEAAQFSAKGRTFPDGDFDTYDLLLKKEIAYWKRKKVDGIYLSEFNRIVIDLERIKERNPTLKAQEACFTVTLIHELLHHESEFEPYCEMGKKFDMRWFIEVVTEYTAGKLMAELNPELLQYHKSDAYLSGAYLLSGLEKLIGSRPILMAAVSGSFEPVHVALVEKGISEPDIFGIASICHELREVTDIDKLEKMAKRVGSLVSMVDTRRKENSDKDPEVSLFYERLCWHTTKTLIAEADYDQNTPSFELKINYGINAAAGEQIFYDAKENTVVLQMGNLRAGHSKEEAVALAIYQTMVAACHHNGSFGNYRGMNLEWLRIGFASQFAREKMKKWYPDREAILKEHTLVEQVSEVMTGLVGQEVMKKAFLTKTVKPIADALQGKGVGNEELAAFLESGCDAAVKGEFDNLLCLAKQFSRKINLIDKPDDAEREVSARYYGRVFGPLGREAAPRMIELRNSDTSLLHASAKVQAVRLNLLADSSAPLPENMAGQLTNRFNGRTTFDATNIENMSSAYLKLLDHAEGEAPLFVENKALEFEAHYGVRPTVRQLMHYMADSIVYQLSEHQSSIPDALAGSSANMQLVEQSVKSIPPEIASKPYKGIYSETVLSCAGVSDYNGNAAGAMATSYIQIEFGIIRPTVTDVTAILALANAARSDGEDVLMPLGRWIETSWKPPMAAASLLAEARVKAPDKQAAEAYLANHPIGKEPDNDDVFRWLVTPSKADVLVSLCMHINYAYPSGSISIDEETGLQVSDEKNRRFLPLASRDTHPGSLGKFSPYAGNALHRLVKEYGLPGSIDPLRAGRRIKMAARAIKKKAALDVKMQLQGRVPLISVDQLRKIAALSLLIDGYVAGGTAGIKFDTNSYRPNGCLNSEEVLERKYALCLEHTLLFISLTRELGYARRTLGFKVFADSSGKLMPHVCGGLLSGDGNVEQTFMEKHILKTRQLPFVFHHLFEMDPEFRQKVLEASGYEGTNPHLLMMDLSLRNIGAQYQTMVPMTELDLLSAYLTDAGTYYIKNDKVDEAVGHFQTALRINPADELARSHLVSYYSDIEPCPEKVIELTDEPQRIVNPEDFLGRALALMIRGRREEAIIAALRALQLSENFEKARIFLDAVGFHRTEPQDNVIFR